MRKLLIVAVLGMVLAIVACGPGAEPTPTPTSTPVVVATPTPTATSTAVVATPTPTAKPLATPTATSTPVVATPTPTAKPLATPTATPKRGGILKARYNQLPGNFYMHQNGTGDEYIAPVYNNLVMQDPLDPTSEKIVPDLADRWEISGDGLTYTFFLHQGVKWSDGIPFTAADVKYNLDLIRNPPTGFASPRKGLFAAVASVEAPNDYTAVLKLSRIDNVMLATLSTNKLPMMPKHLMEKDVLNSMKAVQVGTGPYLFKRFTAESTLVFERKPDYFKPGLPYLDGIQQMLIADTSAFIAALYTGQVDLSSPNVRSLGKTEIQRIQKERPELIQGSAPDLGFQFVALNTKIPPFTDQRVRVAVQDSLDRVVLLNTSSAMGIVGGMMRGTWALPAEELAKLPGFGPDINARRAQARQLLKDAGVAAGTEITLSTKSEKNLNVEIVELMQLQLQTALPSLNVKIRNYPSAEFDNQEASGGLQVWMEKMGFASIDPDSFGIFYTTGGSRNYVGLSNSRIDELQLKQSSILDPAQRRLVVWEVEKLALQQGALEPLYLPISVCSAWPYVKNQVCASAISGGISQRYEIVWLDK